jgi:hypothetical protein
MAATLFVNPVFSALAHRFPVSQLVPYTYGFFGAIMTLFYFGRFRQEHVSGKSAYGFFLFSMKNYRSSAAKLTKCFPFTSISATRGADIKSNMSVALIFYVWMGVFALFNSSLFWSVATDVYTEESASRLFGLVAAGVCGTLQTACTSGHILRC